MAAELFCVVSVDALIGVVVDFFAGACAVADDTKKTEDTTTIEKRDELDMRIYGPRVFVWYDRYGTSRMVRICRGC